MPFDWCYSLSNKQKLSNLFMNLGMTQFSDGLLTNIWNLSAKAVSGDG